MDVELRLWRSFVTVADELHYGRAAERLHITQPALSRQIRDLERALGATLFDRTTRRVTLTTAGRAVLTQARRALTEAERAVSIARDAASGGTGHIVIGVLPAVSLATLPGLIHEHRVAHPGVGFRIVESFDDEQFEDLLAGRIDVGFLRATAGPAGIRIRNLMSESVVAVLPAGHRYSRYKQLALSELADEPFVFFPRHRSMLAYDQFLASCHAAGFSPDIVQEASGVAILGLVAAGIGVSVLAASYRALRPVGIDFVPIVGHDLTLQLAWADRNTNPALTGFFDVIASNPSHG